MNNGIESLAARLTKDTDRETYSRLVSYVNSLPPDDEFRKLAEMLGFVALLGQRIPDAIEELLLEIRAQKDVNAAQIPALLEDYRELRKTLSVDIQRLTEAAEAIRFQTTRLSSWRTGYSWWVVMSIALVLVLGGFSVGLLMMAK